MAGRAGLLGALLGAVLVLAPGASGGVVVTPPAKRVCLGYAGGGITLWASLNRGSRPSPKHWFRVRVFNPAGRLVDTSRGQLDYSGADRFPLDAMWYVPRRTGLFRTVFEAEGWKPTTFRTRVYGCS